MRPTSLALLLLLASPAAAADARVLTLDQALDALATHNPTLIQARARTDQARGVARQATAPVLPTLGAQAGYTLNSHEATASFSDLFSALEGAINEFVPTPIEFDTSGMPSDLVIQPKDALSVGASLRVPLLNASGWATRHAALQVVEASEAGAQAASLQLTRSFVEACWLASAADGMVAAAEHATESARQHHQATARRKDAGLASSLEVLRAETELARRQSDLAQARASVDRAHLALGALLGEAEPVAVIMSDPEAASTLIASGEAALLDQARVSRPELAARQAEIGAHQAQLTAAGLRHLPTLAASGSLFASDEPFPTGEDWGWRVGLDLTWAAYDGGFRYGKATEARAALAGARAANDATALQVGVEVRQAIADVEVARERLSLATHARNLATEAEGAAQRGFEAGLVDSLEVLDAQDRRYAADVGFEQARASLGAAGARLQAAAGAGW